MLATHGRKLYNRERLNRPPGVAPMPVDKDSEQFAARLRAAVEHWHGGKGNGQTALAKALLARKARVTSRGMVRNYLEGKAKHVPPVDFVRDVALITGVRFEWLATGTGEMVEGRPNLVVAGEPSEEWLRLDWDAFIHSARTNFEEVSGIEPDGGMLDGAFHPLFETWRIAIPKGLVHHNDLAEEERELRRGYFSALGVLVGTLMAAPLTLFKPWADAIKRDSSAYVVAYGHALSAGLVAIGGIHGNIIPTGALFAELEEEEGAGEEEGVQE
jgi:hypothetical protein